MSESPSWPVMQAGLLEWFRSRLGTDDLGNPIPADWADEAQYQPPHGIHGELSIFTVSERGQDWTHYEVDEERPAGEDYVPEQRGQRRMTATFVVESQYLEPASSPHVFIERVRTALRSPSSRQVFREIGLGLIRAEAIQRITTEVDERRAVRAVLDVHFHVAARQVDEPGATSWIETVEATAELTGPDHHTEA